MREYLWSKFQQTRAMFGGKGPRNPPPKRGHFMDAASPLKHLRIYNLTTANATLMKLITIMYLHKVFYLAEDWGVTHRAQKGVNQKPLKMSQKIGFLAQFQVFLKNKIKTATCLMHYIALHHWSKFQTNLTTFHCVTSKSSLKLYFLLVWKHLKFQNSRTTNCQT